MAKRTWITVKRGILEPKHRFSLGELIYLYMYILDKTNWESGILEDWLDKGVSEEMEMPISTVRYQRRKLENLGYITVEQKQHGIRVIVHNWTNPKEYTGQKYNVKVPSANPSNNPSANPSVNGQDTISTPSLSTKVTNHKSLNTSPAGEMEENMNKEEYLARLQKAMDEGIKEHQDLPFDNLPEEVVRTIGEFVKLTRYPTVSNQKLKWIKDARAYNQTGCQNMQAVIDGMKSKGLSIGDIGSIIKSAQAYVGEQRLKAEKPEYRERK